MKDYATAANADQRDLHFCPSRIGWVRVTRGLPGLVGPTRVQYLLVGHRPPRITPCSASGLCWIAVSSTDDPNQLRPPSDVGDFLLEMALQFRNVLPSKNIASIA